VFFSFFEVQCFLTGETSLMSAYVLPVYILGQVEHEDSFIWGAGETQSQVMS